MRRLTAAWTLTVALAASCAPVSSHGGPVRDHVSFVDNLRARGMTVDILGEQRLPFLRPSGTRLRIHGSGIGQPAELTSYNYDDHDLGWDGQAVAAADAAGIAPDGQPHGPMRLFYAEPPHFFRRERVIVHYGGRDAAVLALLRELLGPQFAGA
jgi:hypothetical protein